MTNYFEEYSKILREKNSLGDDWHVYEVSCSREDVPAGFARLKGCRFDNYVKGPKKGQPKIYGGKLDKETTRVFFLSVEEIKVVLAKPTPRP